MTAHYPTITSATPTYPPAVHPAKHPLPADNLEAFAGNVVVFTLAAGDLGRLMKSAEIDLPGLASQQAVLRVMAHNPDSIWGIAKRADYANGAATPRGFVGFLMLNEQGLRQLVAGTFDASDPDEALLCAQNEKPAGIYLWAMWARNGLVSGIPLAFEKMFTPLYEDADLYARAVTQDGKRLLETMGFRPGATFENLTNPGLHSLPRSGVHEPDVPLYDRYHGHSPERAVAVTVARSIEDLMRVIAIRSAVYIGEQECPYLEEFDGNDFSSTHLLGYIGNEPVACLRIRYFADFAKIERLAVRKEFRKQRITLQVVEAAIELCRAKGYQRLYGHAQKRLVKFWSQFGFTTFEGGQELVFSDFDYVEMQLTTERRPNAITIGVDPYLIIRPEGQWHRPGVLDQSRARAVTRPSIERGAA
ncbi:MAG: putative N-acetyltransferase YjcF [Tardiphaga sp.]|jgi:predicted GNAT family N-acyltransferase|nr:putative N-acetyltransferase YjcF [Tardiphaga sp.]